ncbi:MAG: hypothetical protein WD627_07435, partial [Actinomycetota bacterium]
YGLLGAVPGQGAMVNYDNMLFVVEKVQGRRITKVLVGREGQPSQPLYPHGHCSVLSSYAGTTARHKKHKDDQPNDRALRSEQPPAGLLILRLGGEQTPDIGFRGI